MNTILFDIETTALVSRTWGIFDQNVIKVVEEWKILCFSYKRLGEKKAVSITKLSNGNNFIADGAVVGVEDTAQ